jgi:rhodanese-related sulfurtransferase
MFGRRAQTPEVEPASVGELLDQGAVLIDVREQYEWEAGHAPQAVHLPMGEITLDNLPDARPLLVVCHVGGRSAAVTDALVRAEVEALNVAGGMAAWERSGLPVVTDTGEAGQVV